MLNDIRYALRLLRRNPGFSTAAVITLALGIGVNTAVYSILQAVWIDAVPFAEPSRLVILSSANEHWKTMAVSDEDFAEWHARNRVFESLGAADDGGRILVGSRQLTARWASADLFRTLDARMPLGRPLLPGDSEPGVPPVAVLSWTAWQRSFGADPQIVGRTVESKVGPVEIVGVAPADFTLSGFVPGAWVSKKLIPPQPGRAGARSLEVIGRLAPGVSVDDARVEMNRISAQLAEHHPPTNRYPGVTLTPIRARLTGAGVGESLWLLLAATAAVLLIACANIANLFLARSASRRRELAVRAAVGARTAHLVRQGFCESGLVAAGGTLAGLLLAFWARDAIVAAMPVTLHRSANIGIDARVLGFTVLAGAVSGLMTGLLPAVRSAFARPLDLLAGAPGQYGATRPSRRLAGGLAGLQVALAVVVLSAAALLVSSFVKLRAVDPGFEPEGILTFGITPGGGSLAGPDADRALHRQILDTLATIPQVQGASATEMLPLAGSRTRYGYRVPEGDSAGAGRLVDLDQRWVAAQYFEILRIPLEEGRGFAASGDPPDVVVVNERAARELWPGAASVLGRELVNGRTRLRVVGVAGNVRHTALDADPVAEIYHLSSRARGMTYVVRTAGSPGALARTVQATVEAHVPVKVTDLATFDELVTRSVRVPQFRARLFSLMGLLVGALALVGIFSVTAYSVADRQREIGIRLALGAEPHRTVRLVTAQASVPAVLGLFAGLTAAFNTNRLLSHLLFATTPHDVQAIGAVVLGVLFTAVIAAYLPARRVMAVDPVATLRAE